MTLIEYHFTVKGTYPNGIKAKLSGRCTAPPPSEGSRMPPMSAFDVAVQTAKNLCPGLNVDLTKIGQVVIQRVRR